MKNWVVNWEENLEKSVTSFENKRKLFSNQLEALQFVNLLMRTNCIVPVRNIQISTENYVYTHTSYVFKTETIESSLSDDLDIRKIYRYINRERLFNSYLNKFSAQEKLLIIVKKFLKYNYQHKYKNYIFNCNRVKIKLDIDAKNTIKNFKKNDLDIFLNLLSFSWGNQIINS
jgi:hypothetical protein